MKVTYQVETLQDLNRLIVEKKSVYCPFYHAFKKPRPAAWMINLAGYLLLQLFQSGMFVYQPKTRRK